MALEPRSRLTCLTGPDRRERVRRIAVVALALLVAGVACGGPRSPGDVEREAGALDDRLAAGDYRERCGLSPTSTSSSLPGTARHRWSSPGSRIGRWQPSSRTAGAGPPMR